MQPTIDDRRISWSPTSVIMTIAIIALAYGLWQVRELVLVVLTATVIATFVTGITRAITSRRIPRVLVVIAVYVIIFFVIGGLMYLLIPVFIDEIAQLSKLLPGDNSFITKTIQAISKAVDFNQLTHDPLALVSHVQNSFKGISSVGLISALNNVFGSTVNLVLVVVVSFYLSIENDGVERFIQAVTPIRYEEYAVSLWRRTEQKISQWLKGQMVLALILAILTYLGLSILGVPYALMLSLLAGIMGLIPFGIFFAGLVALFVSFSAGGIKMMLMVLVWYVLLQQLEAYVLQPQIMRRITGVPSIIILLSLVIFSSLWGFLGLILAVPCAVFFMELNRDHEDRKKSEMLRREEDPTYIINSEEA